MISKGTQYLKAAGFGNIRVTAASIGSLDILGTFRWLNGATKQAIMVAFGADGAAVINATNAYLNGIAATDPTKAQQIADWLNTYAIEDPKIVYSLVDGIGTRFVCNPARESGNTAYIDLQFAIDHTKKIEIESVTEYGYGSSVFGVRYYNNDSRVYITNDTFSYGANNTGNGATGVLKFNIVVNNRTSNWTINGIPGNPQTSSFAYTNKSPFLLGIRTPQDTLQGGYNNRQGTFKFKNGSIDIWLVPFKRNGVMEMLDLISGQLADRHGTFTELIETPTTP